MRGQTSTALPLHDPCSSGAARPPHRSGKGGPDRFHGASRVDILAPGVPAAQPLVGQADTVGGGLATLRHTRPGDRAVAPEHRTASAQEGPGAEDMTSMSESRTFAATALSILLRVPPKPCAF